MDNLFFCFSQWRWRWISTRMVNRWWIMVRYMVNRDDIDLHLRIQLSNPFLFMIHYLYINTCMCNTYICSTPTLGWTWCLSVHRILSWLSGGFLVNWGEAGGTYRADRVRHQQGPNFEAIGYRWKIYPLGHHYPLIRTWCQSDWGSSLQLVRPSSRTSRFMRKGPMGQSSGSTSSSACL